eukprot:PLAT13622.1.p1 GENE.PLAT13622.1~~PLAT13622.1.p1  ORF type:complete len:856 (+),score=290.15 PLAT13622.1:28-2595(+)
MSLQVAIARREKEIETTKALLHRREGELAALEEELLERTENMERLKMRLGSTREEVQSRTQKLRQLKAHLEHRDLAHVPSEAKTEEVAPTVEGGLDLLMTHVSRLQATVHDDRVVDDLMQSGRLGQVQVFNASLGEACAFRITSTYRFGQLLADACNYWDADIRSSTLRDVDNALWPSDGIIQEELGKLDTVPRIQLVSALGAGAMRSVAPSSSTSRDSGGDGAAHHHHHRHHHHGADDDDDQDGNEDRAHVARSLHRRPPDVMSLAAKMSTFFHEARYTAEKRYTELGERPKDDPEKRRDHLAGLCWHAVLYIVFIGVIMQSMLNRRDIQTRFDVEQSLMNAVVRAKFPSDNPFVETDFNGMRTPDEFWRWLEGPLFSTLYPMGTGLGLDPSGGGLILQSSRLLGGVHLQQYRNDVKSCIVSPAFRPMGAECFAGYSIDKQDRRYYAPQPGVAGFDHVAGNDLNTYTRLSTLAFYDRGSFALDLSADPERARLTLFNLRNSSWVDLQTRGITITFNLFNLNYNSFVVCDFLLQFNSAGTMDNEVEISITPLSEYDYGEGNDYLFLVFADAFITIWVWYTLYRNVLEMVLYGVAAFFGTLWNILDMLLFAAVNGLIVMRLVFELAIVADFDVLLPHYVQLRSIIDFSDNIFNLSSVVALLAVMQMFKFLQTNEKVSRIWQTLYYSGPTLGAYLFVFVLMLMAFVLLSLFTFGTDVSAFSGPVSAFSELMAMLSGNFDYQELRRMNIAMAVMFFLLFVFIVMFVLVNVVVAILNDSYSEASRVTQHAEQQDFWYEFLLAPRFCVVPAFMRKEKDKRVKYVPGKHNKRQKAAEAAKKKARRSGQLPMDDGDEREDLL